MKAIENAEEPDCAAQVATEELNETAEIDAAREPMMAKVEDAEEPREAAQSAVDDIFMIDVKSTEIKPKDAGESTETWASVAMDYEEKNEISPRFVKAEAFDGSQINNLRLLT